MRNLPLFAATCVTALLGGCVEQRPPRPLPGPPQACRADRVQRFVGRPTTPRAIERARLTAGARTVRVIPPGSAVTMDYRPDRLNIETGSAGRILRVRCG